jgi:hypothetical protein
VEAEVLEDLSKLYFQKHMGSIGSVLFVIGICVATGMFDYNVRADTSSPEVVSMKIVDKYIDHERVDAAG